LQFVSCIFEMSAPSFFENAQLIFTTEHPSVPPRLLGVLQPKRANDR
jgi:hypothetical protein